MLDTDLADRHLCDPDFDAWPDPGEFVPAARRAGRPADADGGWD